MSGSSQSGMPTRSARVIRLFLVVVGGIALVLFYFGLLVVQRLAIPTSATVDKPPRELESSAENVVVSIYPALKGTADTQKLQGLLDTAVSLYHFMGPPADHPQQPYEYRVGLYMARWHAEVFPARRLSSGDKVYELWIAWYGGGGRWYGVLNRRRVCYVTVADGLWSPRKILDSFDLGPGPPIHFIPVDVVTLPDKTVLEFPPGPAHLR